MLQYERIYISEGTGFDKLDKSKECIICHYWYFKDIDYKYELHACNKYHNLLIVFYDPKNFMILTIKGVDYRSDVFNMRTNDEINLLNNSVLDNKVL